MKTVLVVLPSSWDVKQLAASNAGWRDRYRVVFDALEERTLPWEFDPIAHAERLIEEHRGKIDGVFSSGDYPGVVVAAAVATELGLPGSRPQAILRAGHKYHARIEQAAAAPEAVPRFELLRPDQLAMPSFGFPCFVKPVKGAFSMFAQQIDSEEELRSFLGRPEIEEYNRLYLMMFDRMMAHYSLPHGKGWFIAEELLFGAQTTVEGWVRGGGIEMVGIVDSVMHPGTKSFLRFDHPSALPEPVQERMRDAAERAIARLGLGDGLFNVEMMWDARRDRISIIEINPRICGQFGDLYLAVDGTSTFEVALDLAAGIEPSFARRRGKFACAASNPLRVFEPVEVLRSPDANQVRAIEARHPGALVWNECTTGERIVDFSTEDGASHRYAVINVAGADPEDRDERFESIRSELGWKFDPL